MFLGVSTSSPLYANVRFCLTLSPSSCMRTKWMTPYSALPYVNKRFYMQLKDSFTVNHQCALSTFKRVSRFLRTSWSMEASKISVRAFGFVNILPGVWERNYSLRFPIHKKPTEMIKKLVLKNARMVLESFPKFLSFHCIDWAFQHNTIFVSLLWMAHFYKIRNHIGDNMW